MHLWCVTCKRLRIFGGTVESVIVCLGCKSRFNSKIYLRRQEVRVQTEVARQRTMN